MKLCKISKKTGQELYKLTAQKKNKEMERAFSLIPFRQRLIFVPHCLRKTGKCAAKDLGSYYICAECGACKISEISKKAEELGYQGLFILKGGRTIEKIVEELKPKAVLGVACYFEGAQGMEILQKKGKNKIAVQFISLTKDGCADTDVDLAEVLTILDKKS